jgi:two-component SAPR family response regulator
MKLRRIHILCPKSEICSLIRKTLPESKYSISCTSTEDLNEKTLDNLDIDNIDCLILDNEINLNLSENIKEKFNKVSIVYLPSFNSGSCRNKVVKYIPEPLRLSELQEAIESIFKLK